MGASAAEAGRDGQNDNDVGEHDLNAIVSRANYLVDTGCQVVCFMWVYVLYAHSLRLPKCVYGVGACFSIADAKADEKRSVFGR